MICYGAVIRQQIWHQGSSSSLATRHYRSPTSWEGWRNTFQMALIGKEENIDIENLLSPLEILKPKLEEEQRNELTTVKVERIAQLRSKRDNSEKFSLNLETKTFNL